LIPGEEKRSGLQIVPLLQQGFELLYFFFHQVHTPFLLGLKAKFSRVNDQSRIILALITDYAKSNKEI
jgi:hypothetical protein